MYVCMCIYICKPQALSWLWDRVVGKPLELVRWPWLSAGTSSGGDRLGEHRDYQARAISKSFSVGADASTHHRDTVSLTSHKSVGSKGN